MSDEKEVLSINSAAVVEGSLVAFGAGMATQSRDDAKTAWHYANLVANKKFDQSTQAEDWFNLFLTVMQDCGWVIAHRTYEKETSSSQSMKVSGLVIDAIKVAAAFIPGASAVNLLANLASSAIDSLPDNQEAFELFKRSVDHNEAAHVGLASCIETADGEIVMALGAIHRQSDENGYDVLFFDWDSSSAETYKGTAALCFNKNIYNLVRGTIEQKLGARSTTNTKNYEI